jgi:TFIIF-interacting CTD phosphatase-like protein
MPEIGVYVKDLSLLLEKRDIKDIVIVDNKVICYMINLENGISVKDYLGDPQDTTLKFMIQYLQKLKDSNDVRDLIRNEFHDKLAELQNYLN